MATRLPDAAIIIIMAMPGDVGRFLMGALDEDFVFATREQTHFASACEFYVQNVTTKRVGAHVVNEEIKYFAKRASVFRCRLPDERKCLDAMTIRIDFGSHLNGISCVSEKANT